MLGVVGRKGTKENEQVLTGTLDCFMPDFSSSVSLQSLFKISEEPPNLLFIMVIKFSFAKWSNMVLSYVLFLVTGTYCFHSPNRTPIHSILPCDHVFQDSFDTLVMLTWNFNNISMFPYFSSLSYMTIVFKWNSIIHFGGPASTI